MTINAADVDEGKTFVLFPKTKKKERWRKMLYKKAHKTKQNPSSQIKSEKIPFFLKMKRRRPSSFVGQKSKWNVLYFFFGQLTSCANKIIFFFSTSRHNNNSTHIYT